MHTRQTQQAVTTRSDQQAGVDGGPSDSNVEPGEPQNEGSLSRELGQNDLLTDRFGLVYDDTVCLI